MIFVINSFMGKANLINKISHLDRFLFSINAFIELSKHGKVIVCEASDFKWKSFINEKNIIFVNSKISNYKSRGEAEIEILKYSIPFIPKDEEFICKITSKFLPVIKYNFFSLNKKFQIHGLITGFFFRAQIDSRFIIMSKEFFINNFINLKNNVNDKNNQTLEKVLFKHVYLNRIKFKPLMFELFGKNGFDGKLVYKNKFKTFFWYFLSFIRIKINI